MTKSRTFDEQVRLFGMKNLLLEADLEKLERQGIAIDHVGSIRKDEVVDTQLFDADVLSDAKRMADFYVLYFGLENTIRKLIAGRLTEKYGLDWWDSQVPEGVKKSVAEKQTREKDTPMSVRSDDPLTYTNFGELIDIFNANWTDFADTIRSQKAMQTTLSQFNLIRNVIAHSAVLHEDEITRFKLLIKDWFRISA